ncbi:MAG: SCO family protein [Planctomycetota bacterium]
MNKTLLPYWLAVMAAFVALYGAYKWWQVQQFENRRMAGGVTAEGPPLEEFVLTDSRGEKFRSEAMDDKVWVVSFFFATCAGTCPKLNANIQYLYEQEELQDVHWVSISVDPVNDTQQVLREYAERFGADPQRWHFVRGDLDYIQRLSEDVLKVSNVSWRVHKDVGIIIGRDGGIRGVYDPASSRQLELLRERLLEVLGETGGETDSTEPTEEGMERFEPETPAGATT